METMEQQAKDWECAARKAEIGWEAAEKELLEVRGALYEIALMTEWVSEPGPDGGSDRCIVCGGYKDKGGHNPNCILGRIADEARQYKAKK